MKYLVLILIGVAIITGCRSYYPVVKDGTIGTKGKPDLVNGKNLAFNVCGQCHYDYHIKSFIGEEMRDLPAFMGKVYSANLTNGHVLSFYSDAQLFYLIKTGIDKDGRFIPYMIRPTIADKDLRDIIAYLRTSDAPLKRNDSLRGITRLSLLGKLAVQVGAKPQPYVKNIQPPAKTPVAQGRYLVDIVGCYHCHSKNIIGLNYANPEDSKGYLAGGMHWKIGGRKIYSSNLTPDVATGIGEYDTASFRLAVQEGIGLNGLSSKGTPLQYPMRHFKRLTNEQCNAIFSYLNTLTPVHHKIKGH
jgi:hypothetical protein